MIHPEVSRMNAQERQKQMQAVADRRRQTRQIRTQARAVGSALPMLGRLTPQEVWRWLRA
jgi:hypothetical protein